MIKSTNTDFLNDYISYSVTEQIANHIKQEIVYGYLKEGQKLPSETVMASKLHVSRNTIREALSLLADENLIETKSGRSGGHYVRSITENAIKKRFGETFNITLSLGEMTIEDVFEQRRIIEVRAAYLAALRRTDSDLIRLKESINLGSSEEMTDLVFCKNNYLFNQNIAVATQNKLIQVAFKTLSHTIFPVFKYITVPTTLRETLNDELEEIYVAIYNKNSRQAAKKMSRHLLHFEEFFKDVEK